MSFIDSTYKVCLFGHRNFDGHLHLDELLYPILKNLIYTKPLVKIYLGRNGEFDEYAASVIKRVKKECDADNCEITLVLPYRIADIEFYEQYYDNIIIPENIANTNLN